MATKRKLKQKDSTAQNEENKSKDLLVLEEAKQQEAKKRLKTVRIDRQTIILVDVNKSTDKARKSFISKLNECRGKYYQKK